MLRLSQSLHVIGEVGLSWGEREEGTYHNFQCLMYFGLALPGACAGVYDYTCTL